MTPLEAFNWVQNNPNSISDVAGTIINAERTMMTTAPGSPEHEMASQQLDHAVGRVEQAKAEQDAEMAELAEDADPPTDPEFASACPKCSAVLPCIDQIVVTCHDGSNTRVTLKGKAELAETNGKIYFVADQFASGEASVSGFFKGGTLKDNVSVEVTMSADCTHGSHTMTWGSETKTAPAGAVTVMDYESQTNPRSSILNVDVIESESLAYEVVVLVVDLLLNRAVMTSERSFTITGDPSGSYAFEAITVPQMKFIGSVGIKPPTRSVTALAGSEGRALAREVGMGSRARQVTNETSWQFNAQLQVVVGNNTKNVNLGSSGSSSRTIDSGPSMRRRANSQSGFDRFMSALGNSGKSLAGRLTNERDENKLVDFYTDGPELILELGTEQNEQSGAPGLEWVLTAGVSLDFVFGVNINVYEALKRAARASSPQGRALVAFLEDAEEGRNAWVVEYQLQPALFLDFSLKIGSQNTEDTTGNANLAMTYSFMSGELDAEGHITGSLTAAMTGGVSGMFDSIVTDRTVFKYEASVTTTGGITIKTENGAWGYQLFHQGAVLRVVSLKRLDANERRSSTETTGMSRSAINTQTTSNQGWVQDREQVNTYRLADTYTGPFVPFS